MSLQVTHDGWEPGEPQELCCICFLRTPYWYTPKDVALCQSCALIAKVKDIPTKAKWCAEVRAKYPNLTMRGWLR